jgi:hypothetical protein
MKLHGDLDANVASIIYTLLGSYLDYLWSIYDINQAAIRADITITSGIETVAMPTDLLRLDSIAYDSPYQGYSPDILTPRQYNMVQSIYQNTSGSPPLAVWPDYSNRVYRFQPIPSVTLTGKQMYYPQFQSIAAATDLQFFPLTRLLELFAYVTYATYDGVEPNPLYVQQFQNLEQQLTFKYWSGGDPPVKDPAWYSSPTIAMP